MPARWQPRVVCTFWAWLNDTAQCCDWLWDGNQLVPPMAVPVPPFGQNLPDFHSTEKLKKKLTAGFQGWLFFCPVFFWITLIWKGLAVAFPSPGPLKSPKFGEIPLAPVLEHWELCWTGPQQEPPRGPCLCHRRTSLLPLGLSFLSPQLPCCADVVFGEICVCGFQAPSSECVVCGLNQTWALLACNKAANPNCRKIQIIFLASQGLRKCLII